MRRKPKVNPGREASDTNFMWGRMADRSQDFRGATGERPSKVLIMEFVKKKASSNLLLFLCCGTSSRVALQSKRQAISKESAVLYAMECTSNSFSQTRESENRSAIVPTSRLNFLKALGKRGRTCCNSIASGEAGGVDVTRSGPRPHTEPFPRRLKGIAWYGPAVVH